MQNQIFIRNEKVDFTKFIINLLLDSKLINLITNGR